MLNFEIPQVQEEVVHLISIDIDHWRLELMTINKQFIHVMIYLVRLCVSTDCSKSPHS